MKEFKEIDFPDNIKESVLNYSTAQKADEIRQKIARLDLMLADVQSIVSSYVEYEISSNNPEPEAPMGIPQMANMPDMSGVDLAEMSKLFNGVNNNESQKSDQRSE